LDSRVRIIPLKVMAIEWKLSVVVNGRETVISSTIIKKKVVTISAIVKRKEVAINGL
jgi:hypothetical protein